MSETLVVSEMFGPTIQGEGASTGKPALFVRLGRCNLDCAWCDTPFTWDWKGKNGKAYDPSVELSNITTDEVALWVLGFDTPTVIISGGEPLLQAKRLRPLIDNLLLAGRNIEIETNGTLDPLRGLAGVEDRIRWNVSPKLDCSNVDFDKAINLKVLKTFATIPTATFKFVVKNETDIRIIQEIQDHTSIPDDRIWLMPEGTSSQAICESLPWVIERGIKNNFNVTTRVHVHAYGDKRGV